MVRTGSAAGDDGPTVILLKGKVCRKAFSDEYLVSQGLAPGSTIIMTDNAFMTNDAWYEATKAIISGYNQMPVIKDNPQWSIVEFYDGFGAHEYEPRALELRERRGMITAKEESKTSHVNQAYDRFVAKEDKRVASETLAILRDAKHVTGGIVDQYSLVYVVIAIVTQTKRSTWVSSFNAVNLNPRTRLSEDEWLAKIKPFLQGGATFKSAADIGTAELYRMLPSLFHGMSVEEKKQLMSIMDKHDGWYSVECVREIHSSLSVPYSDMHNLRLCTTLCKEHPEMLEMEVPMDKEEDEPTPNTTVHIAGVTDCLDNFQRVPLDASGAPKLTGEDLFDHMVTHRNRTVGAEPTEALGLMIGDRQMECINPSEDDLRKGRLIADAGGQGATMKIAKRKLDSLAYVRGRCGNMLHPDRMKRVRNQLKLAESMASIHRMEAEEAATKKQHEEGELRKLAPEAATMIEKVRNGVLDQSDAVKDRKFTKKHVAALLLQVYGTRISSSKSKKEHVQVLFNAFEKEKDKLQNYIASSTPPPPPNT